jgi:hypothetical protein
MVRICAEWFIGVDTVIDKVSAAGHCDPGIAGTDHMGGGMAGEDYHCDPA